MSEGFDLLFLSTESRTKTSGLKGRPWGNIRKNILILTIRAKVEGDALFPFISC